MSNSGGSTSRVSITIPNNVRDTIQNIKEINRNHSDEDIYAMLKECSMDPNETTQRLLHLDTFHEVKRKREKRKENVKSRPAEESRGRPAYQGRGTRSAQRISYAQYCSNVYAEGQRNAAIWKENMPGESREKGFRWSPVPGFKEIDTTKPHNLEKPSSVTINGQMKVPNGNLSGGHEAQSFGVGDTYRLRENINASNSAVMPKGAAEPSPCASDPVLLSSCDSQIPAAVGAIKQEMPTQQISSERNEPIPTDRGLGTAESISSSHLNKQEPIDVNESWTSSPMIEKLACGHSNVAQPKILGQCPPAEKVHPPASISVVRTCSPQGVEDATTKIEKLKFSDGQHVIIPSHIQVPDAVKNLLSFGSLDASFGASENFVNTKNNTDSNSAAAKVYDETASKSSSCAKDSMPSVEEGKHVDQPQTTVQLPEKNTPSEPKVSSSATVPKDNQMKEETLPAVGPPFPVVQTTPSFSFGFMPPLLVDPLVQSEGFEPQAHVSNSLAGCPPALSTSSSTASPLQPAGAGQNSLTASPQSVALFRQSYPPNYVPYSHYFSPFYPPPTMHQYFGHTAFPPPLPHGNMYLPPSGVAAGMKMSPPYKPGANTGNQVPVGLPSSYGAYNSAQVGFSPNTSVTSGNSIVSEDIVPSALKENSTYPGQQSEVSTVWLPSAGRDAASFPLNAFLNLPPQGQHLINPQSGPSAFVYHALQPPMVTPAPGLTLLQQSQPTAGSVESVAPHPPSNVYQQQQRQQQVNWNI